MPTHFGKDSKGCFAQWGSQKKYYYECGNEQAKAAAKAKADRQGRAAYAGGYGQDRIGEENMNAVDIDNIVMLNLSKSKIDKDNNIIRDVSILSDKAYDTEGNVFRIFTEKAMEDAVDVFDGALARLDHDRENINPIESRGVRTGYGVYKNIKLNNNLVTGDLCLWDCENARKVLSIAERTPDSVGNSIHAGGVIKEDDDGVEIVQQILPRTRFGFKPSIDLVEDPAATISLFQSKRNKSKSNSKENDMEFKDLTLESVQENRPDIKESFFKEGAKSRDKEVEELIQEKQELEKELDEVKVKQARAEREILVDKKLSESELPDYAKTENFRKQLIDVEESKNGDKVVTVDEAIDALIQDRLSIVEPDGVHDNGEKDFTQDKKKGVSDDAFVEAYGQGEEY